MTAQKRQTRFRSHNILRGLLAISVTLVVAAGGSAQEAETVTAAPSLTALALKLILVLTVIVIMIYLTAWIARRRWRGNTPGTGIRILAHHYVGPRKMIQLLQVGQRGLLIGVTERNISALGELNAEELLQFTSQADQPAPAPGGFAGTLRAAFSRRDQDV